MTENECFICFENASIIRLNNQELFFKTCNCNGWIHERCLEKWYNIHHTCPICRKHMIHFYNLELQYFLYIMYFLLIIKKKLVRFIFLCIIYVHIINILSLSLQYIEKNTLIHDE
jgi:hypothetical protein